MHLASDRFVVAPAKSSLFVANGVTGIRHMSGTRFGSTNLLAWRQASWADTAVKPRILATSSLMDGAAPQHAGSIAVTNAAQGHRTVVQLKREG